MPAQNNYPHQHSALTASLHFNRRGAVMSLNNVCGDWELLLCTLPCQHLICFNVQNLQTILSLFTCQITRESYGMTEVKELVPGGESISVNKNNRWGNTTKIVVLKINPIKLPFSIWTYTQLVIHSVLSGRWMWFILKMIFCPGAEIIMSSHSCQLTAHCPHYRSKTECFFHCLLYSFFFCRCPPSSSSYEWHWLQCYAEASWGGRRQRIWLPPPNRWQEPQRPKMLLKNKKTPQRPNIKPATGSIDTEAAVAMLNHVDGESKLT